MKPDGVWPRPNAGSPRPRAASAQAEQRLAYLMTSSPLGFFDADLVDGQRLLFARLTRKCSAIRADELPDTHQTFLRPAPSRRPPERLAGRARTHRRGHQPVRPSFPPAAQGRQLPLDREHRHGVPQRRRANACACWVSTATSPRARQLEERLHQSEERFNLLVTSSPLGLFRHRPDHGPRVPLAAVEGDARLPARRTARPAPDLARPAAPRRPRGGHRHPHPALLRREPPPLQPHLAPPPQGRHLPLGAVQRHRLLRARRPAAAHARASSPTSTRSRWPRRRSRTKRSSWA